MKNQKSILHRLFDGELNPSQRKIFFSEDYLEVMKQIQDTEQYLKSKFEKLDDCDRFEKLSNMYLEAAGLLELDLFIYAFSLGLQMSKESDKMMQMLYDN